jgi:RhoGEF domain
VCSGRGYCWRRLLTMALLTDAEVDARFRLTEDLVDTEREFLVSFRTIYDVYARPLKKLCSISEDEQKQLFGGVEPILSVSNMLLTKVKASHCYSLCSLPLVLVAVRRMKMTSLGLFHAALLYPQLFFFSSVSLIFEYFLVLGNERFRSIELVACPFSIQTNEEC